MADAAQAAFDQRLPWVSHNSCHSDDGSRSPTFQGKQLQLLRLQGTMSSKAVAICWLRISMERLGKEQLHGLPVYVTDAPSRFWSISLKRSAKIHSHTWCELIPNHGYFRAFWKGFISIWKYVAKIVLEVFHFLRFGNKTPLTKQNFGWSEKALRFFGFFLWENKVLPQVTWNDLFNGRRYSYLHGSACHSAELTKITSCDNFWVSSSLLSIL